MTVEARLGYGFIVTPDMLEEGLNVDELYEAAKSTPELKKNLGLYFEEDEDGVWPRYSNDILSEIADAHPDFKQHLSSLGTGDRAGDDDRATLMILVESSIQITEGSSDILSPLVQPSADELKTLNDFRTRFINESAGLDDNAWVFGGASF